MNKALGMRGKGKVAPAHYIRQWRVAHGLSLSKLAAQIPYDKSAISRIENNVRPYHQGFLEAVARVVGCQPGDLVNRPPSGAEQLYTLLGHCDEQQLGVLLAIAKELQKHNN